MTNLTEQIKFKKIQCKDFYDFARINREEYGYRMCDTYSEISEDDYYYMLEVLPPHAMIGTAFAMSEFNTRSLTNMAIKVNNRYYVAVIDFEFWKESVKSLYNTIKEDQNNEEVNS